MPNPDEEAEMDFEKLIKLAQNYLRDYVLTVLSILTNPRSIPFEGSAHSSLSARSGRTWVFAVLSIAIGSLAYTAGMDTHFKSSSLTSISFIAPLWFWLVAACVSHGVAKVLGGNGALLDTVGAFLRIFPVAYLISGLVAMSLGLFLRAITSDYAYYAKLGALLIQLLVIVGYFPAALGSAHQLRIGKSVALSIALCFVVFAVNFLAVLYLAMSVPMPMMAPPR